MNRFSDRHPAVQEWRETIQEVRRRAEERIKRLSESIIHTEKTHQEILEKHKKC